MGLSHKRVTQEILPWFRLFRRSSRNDHDNYQCALKPAQCKWVLCVTASLCLMILQAILLQIPGHSTKQASAVPINRKEVGG